MKPGIATNSSFLRFRTDADPAGSSPAHRHWKARYASPDGSWAPFDLDIDFDRGTCVLQRASGSDYRPLVCDLVRTFLGVETSNPPRVRDRVNTLALPFEIVGLKMSRSLGGLTPADGPGHYRSSPAGDWMVLQVFVPGRSESFLLGINDRQGCGELVPTGKDDGAPVIKTLARVFN